jgi:hypothetical protein
MGPFSELGVSGSVDGLFEEVSSSTSGCSLFVFRFENVCKRDGRLRFSVDSTGLNANTSSFIVVLFFSSFI